MNRADTMKLIDKIRVAYPGKKYFETKEDLSQLVDIWLEMFGDYTTKFMQKVVNTAIKKCDYPPTFSALNASVEELFQRHRKETIETRETIKRHEQQIEWTKNDEERAWLEKSMKEEEEHLEELESFEFYD